MKNKLLLLILLWTINLAKAEIGYLNIDLLICWQSISCGNYHVAAIKTDGSLWAWGRNGNGQLGDGTVIDKKMPTQIGNATNWRLVSCGQNYTLAIKTDGSLWAWGSNNGTLGDGTSIDKYTPIQIGTATNWQSISCGDGHVMALKTNGSLWAWGRNGNGQLGNNMRAIGTTSPIQIGTDLDWKMIDCGGNHTVALKMNGSLWAWGLNNNGQLGDGTTIDKDVVTRIAIANDWQKISCSGVNNTIAIKTNGSLWAWGWNGNGQLGDGTNVQKIVPIQIGIDYDWLDIATGYTHTLATKTNGSFWTWGGNYRGQLGDGTNTDKWLPTSVIASIASMSGGNAFSIAIKTDNSLLVWGLNDVGELGDNTLIDKNMPTTIPCPIIVPIETVNFDAKIINKFPVLQWTTASEKSNTGFSIERSSTGQDWETIGFVKGNGTTLIPHTYDFEDKNPLAGNNYYRLKQVDTDGQYSYFKIVSVNMASKRSELSLIPNPASDYLTIQTTNTEGGIIEIWNTNGKKIVSTNRVNDNQNISLIDFARGMYVVKFISKNGDIQLNKFIKN
jgi:alpha-tubulin suppressor-like RCC1 family protein